MLIRRIRAACLVAMVTGARAGYFSKEEPEAVSEPDVPVEYGVDVSFPIHHESVLEAAENPLGDRNKFYKNFLAGCQKHYGTRGTRCVSTELDRVAMSLRQPQSMQNYTSVGFKKIRAPEKVFALIKDFWEKNKDRAKIEQWGTGNTYTNNWEAPTEMVSVEDATLRGGGHVLKKAIWQAAKDTITEWTGEELTECSLYGIRVYHEGSILATHVDRLPLVSSAIINVAQDVDEPWPLEVYGHDGKATNVTMLPGDMVLYESHSVLHGRPFPLKGRFMANVFIHFEPVGHSLRHNAKTDEVGGNVDKRYKDSLSRGVGGHEGDQSGLPPYIIPGTPEESHWRASHPDGHRSKRNSAVTGSTVAHMAAQSGNVDQLKFEVKNNKNIVKSKDSNGWTPLHEGARGGHLEVVKYLVQNGADVNDRTGDGGGGTVLYWAKKNLEEDHPVISFLESLGALEDGPEL